MKTNKMYHSYKKLNQKSISSQIIDKYCMPIGPCPTPTMHNAHNKNALLHCLANASVNNQQNTPNSEYATPTFYRLANDLIIYFKNTYSAFAISRTNIGWCYVIILSLHTKKEKKRKYSKYQWNLS